MSYEEEQQATGKQEERALLLEAQERALTQAFPELLLTVSKFLYCWFLKRLHFS